jgi:DNA-binding NarL/FixJ family response regulator
VRNMTSKLDTLLADADGILVVGEWWGSASSRGHPALSGTRFERCAAEVGSLRRSLAAHHPRWLLIGRVDDESAVQPLVAMAWQMYPDVRLAMLGPVHDVRRCERWLRRGCHVYLADSTPLTTVLTALDCAAAVDVAVVDRAFHLHRVRHLGFVPSLTDRQQEVLGLLGRNLTNAEIAAALHVSENTVEFHIRRLLAKLGARNRMQAVRQASDLGLI